MSKAVIILAAGKGSRMKSAKLKVMCEVLGKPMIKWLTDTCKNSKISPQNTCVVVSDDCGEILKILPDGIRTALQNERNGTAHAVRCAGEFINNIDCEDLIVLYGDAPFIDTSLLENSYKFHSKNKNDITVITANLNDPTGYGRIVRDENGKFEQIIEHLDASTEQRKISEINSGTYWFNRKALQQVLPLIKNENKKGEYYLTDALSIALSLGKRVDCFSSQDPNIVLGANDRKGLAELNRIALDMVIDRLYFNGVDIPITDGVIISPETVVGIDTKIMPAVSILGETSIGADCYIGQGVTIIDSKIGNNVRITAGSHIESAVIDDNCTIQTSVITQSTVGNDVKIGPYSQIRPNSNLSDKVKIGNFVEIKNSSLGEKTSVAHLTYIGDSEVGCRVNFGCGVVTVNYDGKNKFKTTIGNDVFVGCNSNLIAPVTIQDDSYIAAGTNVTDTVPSNALAIGRVKQQNKEGWKDKR